ncbi:hypothetical protein Pcinc_006780 [Petrolisthes cinctipes]|uniref:Uncharacterized protein n=1 Tax=Petrolisthes cinctipes TaxID=88211 RepID=A0AAE1KY15_PETCI|nr:hypothetical protein Pcinc_006780 [Petrolisthes cinctipes]
MALTINFVSLMLVRIVIVSGRNTVMFSEHSVDLERSVELELEHKLEVEVEREDVEPFSHNVTKEGKAFLQAKGHPVHPSKRRKRTNKPPPTIYRRQRPPQQCSSDGSSALFGGSNAMTYGSPLSLSSSAKRVRKWEELVVCPRVLLECLFGLRHQLRISSSFPHSPLAYVTGVSPFDCYRYAHDFWDRSCERFGASD